MAASMNLSRSSPFGPLSDISSRRTFAYLIATLNASHPDYDFSHVLRPSDFKRERNLRRVMAAVDTTMNSVRPSSFLSPNITSSYRTYSGSPSTNLLAAACGPAISSPAWGPQMWGMIDKEMKLRDCTCFAYQPSDDPFDGEEAAIWRMHYFFFNKSLKRVAYLYVRGVPVVVHSPALRPNSGRRGSSSLAKTSLSSGANKRAKYWLGDRFADRVVQSDGDDDYEDDDADAVMWDPDEDVEIDPLNDPSSREGSEDEYLQSESEDDEDEDVEIATSPIRGVSEDIASRMDIE
jgi:hypothetical protein